MSSEITVVVASYRYGHLIGACLDSLLGQTRKPDRIIVVDDAAHDGAAQVAMRMGVDAIERDVNLGTVANFQDMLMNYVKTPRVMFLGADNFLRPDAIELMSERDEDIVGCHMYICGELADEFRGKDDPDRCYRMDGYTVRNFKNYPDMVARLRKSNIMHGSSLYNAELAKSVGGYIKHPGKSKPEEDFYLWKRMADSGASLYNVPEPLLYYRRHRSNYLVY